MEQKDVNKPAEYLPCPNCGHEGEPKWEIYGSIMEPRTLLLCEDCGTGPLLNWCPNVKYPGQIRMAWNEWVVGEQRSAAALKKELQELRERGWG